jgi:hypothetical protein
MGRVAAVERRDPDVLGDGGWRARVLQGVQDVVVVQPVGLIVDAVVLAGDRRLLHGGQIDDFEPPFARVLGVDAALEHQVGIVWRKRRTLDVFAQYMRFARGDVTLDQVRFATRGERCVEVRSVAGEGDAPEVEVDGSEGCAVLEDSELFEVGDRFAGARVDQPRRARE